MSLHAEGRGLLWAARQASVAPNSLALWYLGGAGWAVRTEGTLLLFDPFVGPGSPPAWTRLTPPAIDTSELDLVDAVFLTHEHGDHADPTVLAVLAAKGTACAYGPASAVRVAVDAGLPRARLRELVAGEQVGVDDVVVSACEMVDPDAESTLGYVVRCGAAWLQAGDSRYHEGFARIGSYEKLDAASLSIGHNPVGKSTYMDECDAARAVRDLGVPTVIPQHFDLWQGYTMDPARLGTAMGWYAPKAKLRVPCLGERIDLHLR